MKRKTIIVDGHSLNLIINVTMEEYMDTYAAEYSNGDVWDFPIEELLDEAIDIREDIWYYLINGRCYESSEYVK